MRISSVPAWAWFLLFGLLFCAQVIPNLKDNSPINDEPVELTNGYFYWSGDVTTHDYHPPLAKVLEALPLRAISLNRAIPPSMRENQLRAYSFFFQLNRGLFEWMTFLGRSVSLLFGLGVGFLLFWKTREGPPIALAAALVLWAFEPTILAYSGLALADIPVTFFFFAAVLAFQSQLEKPGPWKSLATGALAGAAVCCKFSALVLVPVFVLLQIFHWVQQEKRGLPNKPDSDFKSWITGTIGFLACVGLVYLPGTLKEPSHLMPWVYFWNGLMDMAHYADYHHPTFFLGQASPGKPLVLLSRGLCLEMHPSLPASDPSFPGGGIVQKTGFFPMGLGSPASSGAFHCPRPKPGHPLPSPRLSILDPDDF